MESVESLRKDLTIPHMKKYVFYDFILCSRLLWMLLAYHFRDDMKEFDRTLNAVKAIKDTAMLAEEDCDTLINILLYAEMVFCGLDDKLQTTSEKIDRIKPFLVFFEYMNDILTK